ENTVINSQRHAIYIARGRGYKVLNNLIKHHRKGLSYGQPRASIVIARSKDFIVDSNILFDINGFGIGISPESETIESDYWIENCIVTNNSIHNSYLAGILINSTSVVTRNNIKGLIVESNTIIQDYYLTSNSRGIDFNRGLNV